MYKCRSFLLLQCRKLFYISLMYPNIIYCITCWRNSPKTHLTPLITMQKKIIRALCFAGYREPSIDLFQCLNFLKIEDVCKLMSVNFLFKSTNQPLRCDWFCRNENMYNIRSTGQRILNVPFARSNQYMRSI